MFNFADLPKIANTDVQPVYGFHLFRAMSNGPAEEQDNGYINMNKDGSVTPVHFTCTPPTDEDIWVIFRAIINIRDTGSFDSGGYGNGAALTNGIKIYVRGFTTPDDGLITIVPIKRTTDWQIYAHDLITSNFGSGDEIASVRWTISRSGFPLILQGSRNQYLDVEINDDLTGLNHQYIIIQGLRFKRI